MTDAEKLLAGYATNTLSEEERKRLFQAALRHQPLFDALADEDALRELLADPAARAQVLAALAEPAPVKVIPFHRRMPVLGAAASLLIAATAGLAYWRSQGTERLPRLDQEQRAKPAAPAPVAAPTQAPLMLESVAPPKPQELQRKRKSTPTEDAVSAPAALGAATEAKERIEEAPKPAPLPPAPAPMPAAVADQVQTRGLEAQAARRTEKKAAKADRSGYLSSGGPAAAQNNQLNQANQFNVAGGVVGGVKSEQQDKVAPPTWTLESLEDGRTRVRILWTEGHLVLLRRVGDVITVLAPASQASVSGGRREAIFLVPKGEDALDLYLLREVPTHPATLPAEGAVAGFRQRLRPR